MKREGALDTHDVVVRGVYGAQQTGRAPAATKHDERLFLGVKWHLWARRAVPLRDVVKPSSRDKDSNEGGASEDLEEVAPS